MDNNTAAVSHTFATKPFNIQPWEKTAHGITVVPPEQVSPLLAMPNEILVEIANYLPFVDFCRFSVTSRRLSTTFNTWDRLKKLSDEYYGSAAGAYRKLIANTRIPAVPGNDINDSLLRLAYFRWISNAYLASKENNAGKTSVVTLFGHSDCVRSVRALDDGRLASCSSDQTIKLWDLSMPDGEQCVKTLNEHTDTVYSVIQLPGGCLASCSDDMTVKVWDLNKPDEQQCLATLYGHTHWVEFITLLADGRLASSSFDHTIKVWDLSKLHTEPCVATLHGHSSGVSAVTQLYDGRLASCSGDKTIKLWDLDKTDGQQCVATLHGHTDWVESVTQLPDRRLVSCSMDKTIKVWDLGKPDGQQCVVTLTGHREWVNSVTVLADGRLASCAGNYISLNSLPDKSIKVWDLNKPEGLQCVVTLTGHEHWVSSVTQLPDGRLASGSHDMTVKVWDLREPCMSTRHTDEVNSI